MAIAALVLWMCTAAVGSYLLATTMRSGGRDSGAGEAVPVPVPAPARSVRDRDRFDPPSLQRAKAEPLPGLKELAEFAHPALAIVGLGIWFGYVVSRDRLFAAIGLGVLLGAICGGLSMFAGNARAARRAAADNASAGAQRPHFSSRLVALHGVGAAATLLFAVLIAVRA